MPLAALLNGERVFASDVAGTAIYTCRECSGAMHYVRASRRKDGASVVAHFAHNPMPAGQQRACSSEGESAEHMNGKEAIRLGAPDYFWWLKGAYVDTESPIEQDDIRRRADVMFILKDNQRVVFEIQYTKISRREVAERTRDYHKMRCHIIWCWPERRADLLKFCRKHFYCVGQLSEDGTEVQFHGNISPFRYGPSTSRPFDPEVLPAPVLPPAEIVPFPSSTYLPTHIQIGQEKEAQLREMSESAERDHFWNTLFKGRWEDARPTELETVQHPTNKNPWGTVPRGMRTIVHAYINSEMPQDLDRALELCEQYGLDYATMRRLIFDDMIARARAQAIANDELQHRRIA